MFLPGTIGILLFVSSATAVNIDGISYYLMSSDLPAGGNRTFDFVQPMLLYVSRHESNQKYDTNIRFIDEKNGVRMNAWAAAQSTVSGGAKAPVFIEGRNSITITNFNERVFDDTMNPAVFYFVDASLGSSVFEATSSIERRRLAAGANSTLTVMSAGMSIALFDFKFPAGSSIRLTAGGAAEVDSDDHEIITFDDSVFDANSWANLPLPIVTLTSDEMESFQTSVTTKQQDRSVAPVGVRTVVMSPGYSFENIPSQDRKYSFKLEKSGKVQVEYLGALKLTTSSLEVIGSDAAGKQTYAQKFNSTTWAKRDMNATFTAETVSVDIRHALGAPGGVLVRIYTSGSAALSLLPLLLLSILRF